MGFYPTYTYDYCVPHDSCNAGMNLRPDGLLQYEPSTFIVGRTWCSTIWVTDQSMSLWQVILMGWSGTAVSMLVFYFIQRRTKNAGIVDFVWAAGVGSLAVFYAAVAPGDMARRILLALLAGTWGLRLAAYLLLNRVLGKPEDGRYQMLRQSWADKAQGFFFAFFQVQAIWAVMFSIPFLPAAYSQGPLGIPDYLAAVVWSVAVAGESLADWQLARFRADPASRGKTCRVGLWRYSRHPNYFFEWTHWFTYVCLGLRSPFWWVTLMGPVVMLLFLYRVTGIPYTEKRALESRGEDYRRYQETTSPFVPWFPKRENRCDG
jgi:steroid 5-alpha reductase family enzyme